MGVPFYNVDPNKDKQQQDGQTAGGQQISGDQSLVSGAAPNSGAPAGQPGTGGQIPFTNIQSYMNANPNGGGGDKVLNDAVVGEINPIRNDAESTFNTFKQGVAEANAGIKNNSGDLDRQQREEFSKSFGSNYGGSANNDSFSGITNQLRDYANKPNPALQSYYKAPTEQLNKYQQQLGQGGDFSGLMNQLYSKAASDKNVNMGAGMKSLQEQLDSGQPLQDAKAKSKNDVEGINNVLNDYNQQGNYQTGIGAQSQSAIQASKDQARSTANKFDEDMRGFNNEYQNNPYGVDIRSKNGSISHQNTSLSDLAKMGKSDYSPQGTPQYKYDNSNPDDPMIPYISNGKEQSQDRAYDNFDPTPFIRQLLSKYGFNSNSVPGNLSSNPNEYKTTGDVSHGGIIGGKGNTGRK